MKVTVENGVMTVSLTDWAELPNVSNVIIEELGAKNV